MNAHAEPERFARVGGEIGASFTAGMEGGASMPAFGRSELGVMYSLSDTRRCARGTVGGAKIVENRAKYSTKMAKNENKDIETGESETKSEEQKLTKK